MIHKLFMIGKTIPLHYIWLGWKREDVKWEIGIGKGKCDSSFSGCVEKWEDENWGKEEGEKKMSFFIIIIIIIFWEGSSLFVGVHRKRKKSGLDGVFHLNRPFFSLIKKRGKKIKLIKKYIKLPLIFHRYTFKNMSIIVIYSLSSSIILFFFFFFFFILSNNIPLIFWFSIIIALE